MNKQGDVVMLTPEEMEEIFLIVALEYDAPIIEAQQEDGSWKIYGAGSIEAMKRFYSAIGLEPPVPYERLRERYL